MAKTLFGVKHRPELQELADKRFVNSIYGRKFIVGPQGTAEAGRLCVLNVVRWKTGSCVCCVCVVLFGK